MCVTHGMPCVNIMVLLKVINMGVPIQFMGEQQEEGGGREKRKGGKEKKRKEDNKRRKMRKRGKRKRKRKECGAVSRPRRQITLNCATRGRFPHTLVILCLGAV